MQAYFKLFFYALAFNFLWENLHTPLYLHYRGGAITELILARAAMIDALIILALVLISRTRVFSQRPNLYIFIAGLITAVLLEKWALATGRWAYAAGMPIIPILDIGLTPTIQLALLGVICHWLIFRQYKHNS